MALRQSPVRLLIADDVGVGKTVEAGLIARELLDRGEISRLAVLCPPHLADQWVEELRTKFGLDAVAVLPGTARRLERDCNPGQSVFARYRFVVVSLDLVKTDRWRQDFLLNAPEFVIVDEAHASAEGEGLGAKRHQRYRLLEDLARDKERHLLLVTATPHSGKEDAFRSLLKLLNPDFARLPLDLSGAENARARETLARHLVQRGRKDIHDYLHADTPSRGGTMQNSSTHFTPSTRRCSRMCSPTLVRASRCLARRITGPVSAGGPRWASCARWRVVPRPPPLPCGSAP
ncbi:DEAD/DEAH box helicase [Deinococcus malanensis]|uniref:DEAD/DEAH box helicase n=1 Tax=Deinococcus malanensis TaxID=1706855 RepID=UPI00362EC577